MQASGVKIEANYETTFSASVYEMVKKGMGIAIIDPYTAVKQADDRVRLIPFAPSIPFNVLSFVPKPGPAIAPQTLCWS